MNLQIQLIQNLKHENVTKNLQNYTLEFQLYTKTANACT